MFALRNRDFMMAKWIKGVLALFMALVCGSVGRGAEVDADTAALIGYAFARQNLILSDSVTGVGTPYLYKDSVWVVPLEPNGYVILERDNTLKPIVAFNTEDFPATEDVPDALAALLTRSNATSEDVDVSTQSISLQSVPAPHGDWDLLRASAHSLESDISLATVTVPSSVAKKVTLEQNARWNQWLPYNLYAPGTVGYLYAYGSRAPIGCVAVAEAQVAQFFEWPYRLRRPCKYEKAESTSNYQTFQVSAPGEPYDWQSIASYDDTNVDFQETPYGTEVARLLQHWATGSQMVYTKSPAGATTYANAGFMLDNTLGWRQIATAGVTGDNPTDEELEALRSLIREGIIDYEAPVLITISGHAIVGIGWAEAVDSALTGDCYAQVNYGWGQSSTTGWYVLANSASAVTSDEDLFLYSAHLRLPLTCGEVTSMSSSGTGSTFSWYESPYWMAQEKTSRTLRRVTFSSSTTATRTVNLSKMASSSSNYWTYTSSQGLTRDAELWLAASVFSSEVFMGGSTITLNLTRKSNGSVSYWESIGCKLYLRLVSLNDGSVLQEERIQLPTTIALGKSGTVQVTINVPEDTPWQLELHSGSTGYSNYSTIPYYITKISVAGSRSISEKSNTFTLSGSPDSTTGLYSKTFTSSYFPALSEGSAAWCAIQIDGSNQAIWSRCALQAAPEITWNQGETSTTEGHRLWLSTPETSISFDITDNDSTGLSSVTAYLSNALWLDPDALTSEDGCGIPLTPTATGSGSWNCTFTLPPNPDTTVTDRLSLDSVRAVGHDAILSVKVVDAEGNATWADTRITFGITEHALSSATTTTSRAKTSAAEAMNVDYLFYSLRNDSNYADVAYDDLVASYNAACTLRYTESELKTLLSGMNAGTITEVPVPEFVISTAPTLSNGKMTVYFLLHDGYTADKTLFRRIGTSGFSIYAGESLDSLTKQSITPTASGNGGKATLTVPTDAKSYFFRVNVD